MSQLHFTSFFSFQCIASIMLHATLELKMFYFTNKIQDPNVIAAAEVPGLLAQLVIVSSMHEQQCDEIYDLIYLLYTNELSGKSERKVLIESLWFELFEYLKVIQNFSFI